MTEILLTGTVHFDKLICLHCNNNIYFKLSELDKVCAECGALYTKKSASINNHLIEVLFSADGFACLTYNCVNVCPSSYMFCEDHSDEEAISKQKDVIQHTKDKTDQELKKLDLLERSRKTWLIMKLSGVE